LTLGRIDTHTHVLPPPYRQWLASRPGYAGPHFEWSPAGAKEAFEAKDVRTGILSVSSPGVRWPGDNDAEARRLARAVNEYCAEVVREDPDHFGFFATLVLPDVTGSIVEATYALEELGADGVVLLANSQGDYLGAAEHDPLLEYLNERDCVVFVHPTNLPGPGVPGISPGIVDFLADTSRAAVNLLKRDCLIRYPAIRWLLSHGGGYLPYAANRIASTVATTDAGEDAVLTQMRRFYFDTALTGGPFALPSLLAFADPAHLTFGTDWPYEYRPGQSARFTDRLDAYPLPGHDRQALNRGNAEILFPRLRSQEGRTP